MSVGIDARSGSGTGILPAMNSDLMGRMPMPPPWPDVRRESGESRAYSGRKSDDSQAQDALGQLEAKIQQGMKELEGMLR